VRSPTELIQHVHHVEDVPRVLPVHRRDQLAAIELRAGQDRYSQIGGEEILGAGDEPARFDRQYRAPKDEVDLDLDLGRVVADHELDVVSLGIVGRWAR